ncbi:hypothetical protein HIMB5_00013580 [alpha proteobacterium HIMB5]|nr:hypothetical protein HIMB5_00013580 [alpha proteobacterium HIMB5]
MTNLKKVGLTALAGSLAAVSANAGELAVSGSTQLTYVTGESANSASKFGQGSGFSLTGSGEMDNGWSVSHAIHFASAGVFDSSATTLTMGDMGSIAIGGAASINGAYDEAYATAYEEVSDGTTASSTSMNTMGAFAGNGITYNAPAIDVAGASVALGFEYTPQGDGAEATDGTTAARTDATGKAMGLGVTVTTDMGLTLGAYGATMEDNVAVASTADARQDRFDGTWFAKYAFGPVVVSYQTSYVDAGVEGAAVTTGVAKTVGTSSGVFEAEALSLAFNVNDDLSISYTDIDDTYDNQDDNGTSAQTADVTQSMESIQIAYSMGSMSIKAYTTETTNPNYLQDAATRTVNEIAVGLAF